MPGATSAPSSRGLRPGKMGKDYSKPLFVDCSIEYDLPNAPKIPKNSEPILMVDRGTMARMRQQQQQQMQQQQQQQQQRQQCNVKDCRQCRFQVPAANPRQQQQQQQAGKAVKRSYEASSTSDLHRMVQQQHQQTSLMMAHPGKKKETSFVVSTRFALALSFF